MGGPAGKALVKEPVLLPWGQQLRLLPGGPAAIVGRPPRTRGLPSPWGLLGPYLGWAPHPRPLHSQEWAPVILSSLPDPSPAQNWIKNKNMSCVCFNQLQDVGAFPGEASRPELAPGQAAGRHRHAGVRSTLSGECICRSDPGADRGRQRGDLGAEGWGGGAGKEGAKMQVFPENSYYPHPTVRRGVAEGAPQAEEHQQGVISSRGGPPPVLGIERRWEGGEQRSETASAL